VGKADLHIHSTASDGHSSPPAIVKAALDYGLNIISITDHDTIDGMREAQKVAENTDLKVLPGVELTSNFEGNEAHLLAYCFDMEDTGLDTLLRKHKRARLKRGIWIVEQLKKKGLDLDIHEVKAEANGSNIGRPHIAEVLLEKGYVFSFKEAFIRYLGNGQLGPIPNEYYSVDEIISVIRAAGGAVIVAHPGRMYSSRELKELTGKGIDGIEVLHPSHNYELQKKMERFAEEHELLQTGGSDFHGGEEEYQKYFGVLTVSSNVAHQLIRMTDQRKKISA